MALPYLRQMCAVGGRTRDPRAPWALSVAYRGLADAAALDATPGKRLEALRAEVDRLELPFGLLPQTFTLTEPQALCEALLGRRLDKSSFRRRLDERDLVEPVAGEMRTGAFRPAQLYRARSLTI